MPSVTAFNLVLGPGGEHYLRTFAREQSCRGGADTAAGAGDEGDLVGQQAQGGGRGFVMRDCAFHSRESAPVTDN